MRKTRKNKLPENPIVQTSIYGKEYDVLVCPYCLHSLCLLKNANRLTIKICPECGQPLKSSNTSGMKFSGSTLTG